jgi:hypothetical protein
MNRSITKYIEQETSTLEEGFLRGIGGDIKDGVSLLGLLDSLKAIFGNSNKSFKILKKKINDIDKFIKKYEFKGTGSSSSGFIKSMNKIFYWRFYFLLNDIKFKDLMSALNNGELNKMHIDKNFGMRVIKEIYNSKSNKDLLNITDTYLTRAASVLKFCKQKKISDKIVGNLMNIFAQGAIDLEVVIRKLVRYND